MIKDKTKKEVFIIYGYKELDDGWRRKELSHPRWYIGLKAHDQRKIREYPHKNPKSDSAWSNWVRKPKREEYKFDQLVRCAEIETFHGTEKEAEMCEVHYTDLYDAMSPNRFVNKSSGYGGRHSDESKKKIGRASRLSISLKKPTVMKDV